MNYYNETIADHNLLNMNTQVGRMQEFIRNETRKQLDSYIGQKNTHKVRTEITEKIISIDILKKNKYRFINYIK